MSLDLYLKETANLAKQQSALLEGVRDRLRKGENLTPLEESGVLHALQILIENAIGKTKQTLKFANEPVPTSAYAGSSYKHSHRVMVRSRVFPIYVENIAHILYSTVYVLYLDHEGNKYHYKS